jgi:hypothetical protein
LALTAARLAVGLTDTVGRCVHASDRNLGHVESQVAQQAPALLRPATETAAQQKANATPPRCPDCGQPLRRRSPGHARSRDTRCGTIRVCRARGYCKRCGKWRRPADTALGLDAAAGCCLAVQEMAALVGTKLPVAEAAVGLERLTGVKLPRATLDREARRQGQRAQAWRRQRDKTTAAPPPAKNQPELPLAPYQMILQIDAWHLRERDDWGGSAARRRQGQEPERWHWGYTGTGFRLAPRGQTAGGPARDQRAGLCGHA